MALVIELVDAPALYKAVESTFIGSFMDIQPTGGAAQISLGLLKGVLAFGLVGNLLGQEIGNDLSPGEFFLDGPARAMLLRVLFLQQHLWTLLGQLVCYGVCCDIHFDAAAIGDMVLAMAFDIGAPAAFCIASSDGHGSFLVQVVLLVSEHERQTSCCMPVDFLMILVKDCLPFRGLVVLERAGPRRPSRLHHAGVFVDGVRCQECLVIWCSC